MIKPGLERIGRLLKDVHIPWKSIHVAGTNGKGSICALAHSLLARRAIPCGRFTSPHLVDRWDCISINNAPVKEGDFLRAEQHFQRLNERENIGASEFELLTATAFKLFTDHKIEIGVVEVGMGGRLDATNILNNQVVSVISKVSYDHMNFLGHTLDEIARHKAGILRPSVPYLVNQSNEPAVLGAIDDEVRKVGAGPDLLSEALLKELVLNHPVWQAYTKPLRQWQKENTLLAVLAVIQALPGHNLPSIVSDLKLKRNIGRLHGRCEPTSAPAVFGSVRRKILLDGAHNEDAAKALDDYVTANYRQSDRPVTWVIAMTEGKDPRKVLSHLLRKKDKLVITIFREVKGMPWVKRMSRRKILKAAHEVMPGILAMVTGRLGVHRALTAVKYLTQDDEPIVVAGSLYLVGDFWREKRALKEQLKKQKAPLDAIDAEERARVSRFLAWRLRASTNDAGVDEITIARYLKILEERRGVQEDIDMLAQELKRLQHEEQQAE